jgi:benzoyl-CoA reductase/2-hydroxyglutaryl-CoA dehydratase subunit BcrC/BadD/HgdB
MQSATRREHLRSQKDQGRRVVGVFPAQYPRELLWAHNALPVEIWDPPLTSRAADAHLQPYICSVVGRGLELLLQGKAAEVDGFLFPHTCDSIQNLASVVHDYIGLDKPCWFFYHPKEPHRASAHEYYLRQLELLDQALARELGPRAEGALEQAVEWGRRICGLMGRLYAANAAGELDLDAAGFCRLVRRAEWLWPEALIPELEAALARRRQRPDGRTAVVLSGVLPNPPEILRVVEEAGFRLGFDDLLAMSRRWLTDYPPAGDPWEALAGAYFGLPPCSSKDSPLDRRLAWLADIAGRCQARGVIFYLVKFCETELFDVPILTQELKRRGLAAISLDTEINQGLSGQITTRVEAFLEMLEQ